MGTQVSTQSSFAKGVSVKFSLGIADGKTTGSLDSTTGYTSTTTNTTQQTVTKSNTLDVKVSGNGDGVDHDQDVFLLLLNPAIALSRTSVFTDGVCTSGELNWLLGINLKAAPAAALYKVSVGDLKNPANMAAPVAAQFKALNFTTTDFQTILAQDPFANGGTTIDTARFAATTTAFPYEPPDQSADCNGGVCSCVAISDSVKNEFATQVGTGYQTQYKTSVTLSLGGIPIGDFTFGSSITDDFTWTSSSTVNNTTDSSQTATAQVQCPSTTYNGPTLMTVYWDTLYGSFVFVPTQLPAATSGLLTQGVVTGATGQPIKRQPVSLAVAGKTFHTYTDGSGKYRFVLPGGMPTSGAAQLSTMGTVQTVNLGSSANIKTSAQ